jgi:hypothetical protein
VLYRLQVKKVALAEKISFEVSVVGPVEIELSDVAGASFPSKEFTNDNLVSGGKEIKVNDAHDIHKIKITGFESGQYKLRVVVLRGDSHLYSTEVVAKSMKEQVDLYAVDIPNNRFLVENASYISLLNNISSNNIYESCTESNEYYVVSEKLNYASPTKIYVYEKTSQTEKVGDCRLLNREEVFVMDLGEASYLRQIVGDVLLIDSGTGPSPREISGFSLVTQKEVFSDSYGSSIILNPPDSISYWSFSYDIEPTIQNCKEKKEIEENYLTPSIQRHITRNLVTGEIKYGDLRCVATQ